MSLSQEFLIEAIGRGVADGISEALSRLQRDSVLVVTPRVSPEFAKYQLVDGHLSQRINTDDLPWLLLDAIFSGSLSLHVELRDRKEVQE